MASEIRVNQIQNRSGLTTTTFTDTGVTIAGILTVSENLNVGGVVTYEDVTNVDAIGIVTARAGINLVGNDLNVGSNIKLGNASGIVTATTFVGNLTGTASGNAALTGSTNNTVCTVTGANAIQGEAGLTYDGSALIVRGSDAVTGSGGTKTIDLRGGDANNEFVNLSFATGAGGPLAVISAKADATGVYPNTTGSLTFNTQVGGGIFERLRITSAGKVLIGTSTPQGNANADDLVVSTSGHSGITIRSGTSSNGNIFFADGTSGGDEYRGVIDYNHSSNHMSFSTNAAERFRISSAGHMGLGVNNPTKRLTVQAGSNNADIALFTGNDLNRGLLISTAAANSQNDMGVVYHAHGQHGGSYLGEHIFKTNNAERLRIHKDGYVTKANHPSFCARYQSGDGYVSTNIFRLTGINNDNFTWNTGGHYSTSTGKFTCPVAGVYFFEGQAMTTGHSNNDNIQDMMELRTNNGLVTYCRQRRTYFKSDVDANGYYVNGTSGQVNLAVGDTVWFQRRSGLGYSYGNSHYTYFTGWLIG